MPLAAGAAVILGAPAAIICDVPASIPTGQAKRPITICTIGDLILDAIVLPKAPLVPDGDTPAQISLSAGGQAANVAAWAAVLGARARLICVRGSDPAAALAISDLERRGVEICGPTLDGPGGTVVSTREPDGARTMASDPGVAGRLDPSEIDPGWITGADVLHVSGYCLLREPMAAAAIAAAGSATRTTLDLASAHDIALFGVERFRARVAALAPELIFANQAERDMVGDLPVEWVIKHGAGGASFPGIGHRPAATVTPVDSTGAGDALAAGYLVGGPGLGMAAAARCVGQIGAMPPPGAPIPG